MAVNTLRLKKFAPDARRRLHQLIEAKMKYVLNMDSPELREKEGSLDQLKTQIILKGEQTVIEQVAYTWFNRFVALRYMDVRGFQPLGVRIISPTTNGGTPEILSNALSGRIPAELEKVKNTVLGILSGSISSRHPQNEAYSLLLIAACNHLHQIFPFLFGKLDDYTELLLPEDLISGQSIIQFVREGMTEADCQEVEIIGWLYQFYISEWNDELISSKKVYKKNELAPASQLFTPKWIVQYMVDNTLGQLWTEIKPNTNITATLDYYIKPAYKDQLPERPKKSIEDIKFFEPCTGSGHILSYAFDVFYKIYEEEGYNPSEIPELIITKNLFGVDIDQRAAQLASFVLIMKGRQKNRRFLRTVEKEYITPNVYHYQDFEADEKFKNATALGSLIKIEEEDIKAIKVDKTSLFGEQQQALLNLYKLLGQRYDVVVTNPPYISSSRMEGSLKQYVEAIYPETKSDLFANFILRCLELCNEDGLTGYMTPFVWMFISSYEKLRKVIIEQHFINNLIQLEYSGFDGATVPICTFTLRNKDILNAKGSYIRLSDFKGSQNQAPKTLEAIQNPNCGWFYTANQKDFEKIPGSPIGYWLSEMAINNFNEKKISEYAHSFQGLISGNNDKLMRFWPELPNNSKSTNFTSYEDAVNVITWVPYQKGGSFRKWYGNNEYYLFWNGVGNHLTRARTENRKYYFKRCLSWTFLSSSKFGVRKVFGGQLWDVAGSSAFPFSEGEENVLLGLLCSHVGKYYLDVLNPTLNFQVENILSLPLVSKSFESNINNIVDVLINISKQDWDSRETSWDFLQNELLKHKSPSIEESYDLYQQYWRNKFFQLHKNEEELNRQFIEIYGLQEELTPDVPLEEITILKDELDQKELKKLSEHFKSVWEKVDGEWRMVDGEMVNGEMVDGEWRSVDGGVPVLPFKADEVFRQFVSYGVGCMFGRYSLDMEGLILANQGETVEDYFEKIERGRDEVSFLPDEYNIIPILDEEWFEDDIVARFYAFLKASFGEDNFRYNLAFVEKCLDKDMRTYFNRDFYKDHVRRYKKRPIYWKFSSPKGHFSVLIYMHRYTPATLSLILHRYLRPYIQKLEGRVAHYKNLEVSGNSREQREAKRELGKLDAMLEDCKKYDRDILYPLASERISIDLDDGVLVNYNKFGAAVEVVTSLNDKKKKDKVRGFDWIDASEIR